MNKLKMHLFPLHLEEDQITCKHSGYLNVEHPLHWDLIYEGHSDFRSAIVKDFYTNGKNKNIENFYKTKEPILLKFLHKIKYL